MKTNLERAQLVLDELDSYLSNAKCALFSSTQISVDRIRMQEYLVQLRQLIKTEQLAASNIIKEDE